MLESLFNSECCEKCFEHLFWKTSANERLSNIDVRKKLKRIPLFLFSFLIGFLWKLYLTYNVSLMRWEINSKQYIYTRVNKKMIKNSRKEYVIWICFKFGPTNEKHFLKRISQWEFDYGLFTNLSRIIVACDFSASS